MPKDGWYLRMAVGSTVCVGITHDVIEEIEDYMINAKNPTESGCVKIFKKKFKKVYKDAMSYRKSKNYIRREDA